MKWNACGNVLISRRAVEEFFLDINLEKSSQARHFGGRGNARCFVAEHMYPTKALQDLTLNEWKGRNPSLDEFKLLMKRFNRICYIWHEEDKQLEQSSCRSSLPRDVDLRNVTARYRMVGIEAHETYFPEGKDLFALLKRYRDENRNVKLAITEIAS